MSQRRVRVLISHVTAAETLTSIKSSLMLATASAIVDSALELGHKNGMQPLTVVVLDSGGHIVTIKREDGSGLMRCDIAAGKAWGALSMGMSTRMLRDRLKERPTFMNALSNVSHGRWVPVPGGVLILDAQGDAVGAVGISGDTSDKDEYCAIEAIRSQGFACDPATPVSTWRESSLAGK